MGSSLPSTLKQLIPPGSRVFCAVSGGADSVCLLHLLRSAQAALDFSLSALHFDHCLRGAESDRDRDFVRSLCRDWELPLLLGSGDVSARQKAAGESQEQAARALRYAFFHEAAGPEALIATAHTADDNLETVLINLLRGTGLSGLSGIPQTQGQLIRPLLDWTREEVMAYLQEHDLPHVEDSSNQTDDYLRNRLRHQVLPLLRQENPDLSHRVRQTTALLRLDGDYLNRLSEQALTALAEDDGTLAIAGLPALDEALQGRVILFWLRQAGVDALGVHVQAVLRLVRRDIPSGQVSLPGGRLVRRVYDRLELAGSGSTPVLPPTLLNLPGETILPGCTVRCQWQEPDAVRDPSVLWLDPQALSGPLVLRSRLSGDILPTASGHKLLKKLLIDEKVPAHLRSAVPVLADDSGPIAVLIGGRWLGCPRRGKLALEIVQTQCST